MDEYYDYYQETPIRECLLNGKIVHYDACGSNKEESDQFYEKQYKYIGSSNTYYINGTENKTTAELHFYIKKP